MTYMPWDFLGAIPERADGTGGVPLLPAFGRG